MAQNEDLKVRVGADTRDLEQGTKRAVASIQSLQKANEIIARQAISGKKSWEDYNAALSRNNKQINLLQGSLRNAASATGKVGAANAQAVPAMQEFSRIIQDAPYGIQGVANNVQQLTAQFQYLSAKSGGAVNALKAMAGSLAGPAGVLLAVSALTVAWPQLVKLFSATATEAEKMNRALDASKNRLSILKGEQTTIERLIQLRTLQGQSVDLLVKKQALLMRAQMLEASIAARSVLVQKERLQAEIDNVSKLKALWAGYISFLTKNKDAGLDIIKDPETLKKIQELEKDFASFENEIVSLSIELNTLALGLKASGDAGKEGAAGVREYASAISALVVGLKDAFFYWDQFQDGPSGRSTGDDIAGGGWVTIFDPEPLLAAGKRLKEAAGQVNNDLKETVDETLDISGAVAAGFANFGQSIGAALASGSLSIESAGNTLLATFGDFLASFGTALIAWGFAKSVLDNLAISGVAAIAAGTALVIAGKALSAAATSGLRSVVNGGSASIGGGGSSSFSGSTVATSAPSTGGRYVFEIEGTKLVGVLSNTLARNRALGGDLSLA